MRHMNEKQTEIKNIKTKNHENNNHNPDQPDDNKYNG
jgi:hypothetical protein